MIKITSRLLECYKLGVKFKEYRSMKSGEELKRALTFVTEKIKENVAIIKSNCNKMKERNMQVESGLDIEKTVDYFSLNNELLQENKDLLKIQAELSNYMVKYSTKEEVTELSRNDLFKMTIQDEIAINDNHPLIGDKDFLDKLLCYYKEVEQYEKCSVLLNYIK